MADTTADGMDHMVAKVRKLMASLLLNLKVLKAMQMEKTSVNFSMASLKASMEANALTVEAKVSMEEEENFGERRKPDLFHHHKRHKLGLQEKSSL